MCVCMCVCACVCAYVCVCMCLSKCSLIVLPIARVSLARQVMDKLLIVGSYSFLIERKPLVAMCRTIYV